MSNCINSSKVYCKFISCSSISSNPSVLIVAKCIVNEAREDWGKVIGIGINSSKVYCKFQFHSKVPFQILCINSSKVYCKGWLQFNILIAEYLKALILLCSMYFYWLN